MVIFNSALRIFTFKPSNICGLVAYRLECNLNSVSQNKRAQLESPGTFEMTLTKFWHVEMSYLPESKASSTLTIILFANPSELAAI